jgi:hypothetical protein
MSHRRFIIDEEDCLWLVGVVRHKTFTLLVLLRLKPYDLDCWGANGNSLCRLIPFGIDDTNGADNELWEESTLLSMN